MTALNAPSALSLATVDGHVVRATGVSGSSGTYQDISPTVAQRAAIGAAIKLLEDPASTKRLILFGQYGGLVCDDVTQGTPSWRAVNLSGDNSGTWSQIFDFTVSDCGWSAIDGGGDGPLATYVIGTGWTSAYQASAGHTLAAITKTFSPTFSPSAMTVRYDASIVGSGVNGLVFGSQSSNPAMAGGTDVEQTLSISVAGGVAQALIYASYSPPQQGSVTIKRITFTGTGANPFGGSAAGNEVFISDLVALSTNANDPGTWSQTFDFSQSDQGWTPVIDTRDSQPLSTYIPGMGWKSVHQTLGDDTLSAITKAFAPALGITSIAVTYVGSGFSSLPPGAGTGLGMTLDNQDFNTSSAPGIQTAIWTITKTITNATALVYSSPQNAGDAGQIIIQSITLTGQGANPFTGLAAGGYFGWLSKKTISSVDYVYFNYTGDLFNMVNSTLVATYNSALVYSIMLPPVKGNTGKVWVTAGSPGSDAAVYESPDGGAHFARLNVPAVGSGGGVLDLPFTLPGGSLGATAQNLVTLDSVDAGTNNLHTSGLGNVLASISGVGGPLTRQSLVSYSYDGKSLNAVVHNGSTWTLLKSDDGGQSWTTTTLTAGWEAASLAGWSSSKSYLVIGGTNTLAYTPDRGVSWSDLWSGGFSAWANSAFGVWSNKIISALVGLPPAPTHDGVCPCQFGHVGAMASSPLGNPISAQNGDKYEEVTDLALNTPAGPLTLTRTFRQSKEHNANYNFLGLGWTHNHAIALDLSLLPTTLILRMPTAGEAHFTNTSANHWEGDPGSASFIDYNTGTSQYTLTAADTSTYVFDSTGKLLSRSWPSHETWTYTYTSGKLTRVDDGYGRQLNFTYISNPGQYNDGQLWRVGDQNATGLGGGSPTGNYIEFAYIQQASNGTPIPSPKALLLSVRDVLGNTWTYDYYGQHSGETITAELDFLTKRLTPSVDTTGDGTPDGALTLESLSYMLSGSTITNISQQRGIQGASPALLQTDFAFQPGGQSLTTETVAGKTTTHQFANSLYLGSTDPAGNSAVQTPNFQYRPEAQKDTNGNATLLQWSADGKLLQQVNDAQGNVTQFNYNSGGASDSTLDYSLDAQGRKTKYLYGDVTNPRLPTEVKVIDTDNVTVLRWQKFSYDSKGRTLTEQTMDPATGTIVQQEVDRAYYTSGNGNGLLQTLTQKDLVNPANNLTTTYFYDPDGRLIKISQSALFGNCTISFTVYDPAGNVVATICNYDPGINPDPTTAAQAVALYNPALPDKNRVTTYVYDAAGRRVSMTTDAGAAYALTTLTVYDALNRVVRTIANYVAAPAITDPYVHKRADFTHGLNNDQNLITETAYNERGLVRSQTDLLGNVVLFGYDDAGRLVKTVQNASQPSYNNTYGAGGDPTLSVYYPSTAPDLDLITSSVYDPAGNLVKSTDVLGNVTFTVYDPLNRPVKTVRSASLPSYNILADPALVNYIFSTAADQDLVDMTEYDSLGRVRRSQDALGNWTLFGYDGLGRQSKTIRNASQPNYNLDAGPSLSQYYPSANADLDLITTSAFDTAGRVMTTTDVLGRSAWSGYDGLSRLVRSVVNAVGTATDGSARDPRSSSYNPVVNLSDRDLISLTAFDSNAQVMTTTDPLGRTTWYGYDSVGRPIQTTVNALGTATDGSANDPRSPVYAARTAATDVDLVSRTAYNAQGRVAATIDPLGRQTSFVYDALGRRIQTIANFVTGKFNAAFPDQDLITTTVYDLAGRVLSILDPRGTLTTFTYDRAGRRLTVTQASGTSLATTSYTCYDKGGRVVRVIANWINNGTSPDAKDVNANYLFNPGTHGANNDQNLITVFTYDRLGRQTLVTNPVGNTAGATYYKDGQIESTTDPLSVVTKFRYDAARRRTIAVTSYVAGTFTDPASWVWSTANSRWQDGNGNAITFGTNNDQNIIVQTTFDKAGRMLALRDPKGNMTTYTYDLLDHRTSTTDPLAHIWSTSYGYTNGQVQTSMTDPLGNVTQQTTDRLGRPTLLQYVNESPKNTPDITFSYDKVGNRVDMKEMSAASTVRDTKYTYDQARRLTKVDFDTNGDGTIDQTVAYGYDAGGLRTKMTLPGSLNVNYVYDALGRFTSLTDWSSQATQFTYDGVNRFKTISRSNSLLSTYTFDAAGRLVLLRHTNAARVLGHFAYTVDARGNRTAVYEAVPKSTTGATALAFNDLGVNYYQGTWSAANPYETSTDTTAALRLAFFGASATLTMGVGPDQSMFQVWLDGALFQTVDGYKANAGDTTVSITASDDGPHSLEVRNTNTKNSHSSGFKVRYKSLATPSTARLYDLQSVSYFYDALARLSDAKFYPGNNTSLADGSLPRRYQYNYDRAGNRSQQIASLSGAPTTTNYTYDAANRLISDSTPHTYTYDNAGRLTSDGVNSYTWDRANRLLTYNGTAFQYAYNGLGQRVQQSVSGTITQYVLDVQPGLWQVLSATTGANVTRYVFGPKGMLQQQVPAGTWNWLVSDGLGNIRGVVNSTTAPIESQLYDPFGIPYGNTGGSQTNFGFTGEWTDGDGLLNLRARYYNPTIGQFFSLDPLETLNRYQYVYSNPSNRTDPSGLGTEICFPDVFGGWEPVCEDIPSPDEIAGAWESIKEGLEWLGEHLQPTQPLVPPVSMGKGKSQSSTATTPIPLLPTYGPSVPAIPFPNLPVPGVLPGTVGRDLDSMREILEKINTGCWVTFYDASMVAARSQTIANELTDEIQKTGKKCDSTVYRVQTANPLPNQESASKEFFDADAARQGRVVIRIPARLYVIFDNPREVVRWLVSRRTFSNNYVISARIDNRFVQLVRGLAYRQSNSTAVFDKALGTFGEVVRANLPDIADARTSVLSGPGGVPSGIFTSYGIPLSWIPAMIASICSETLKVSSRDEFFTNYPGGNDFLNPNLR